MGDAGLLVLRGLVGGTLVVAFALVGEIVSPKAFSGLFSAAPSVALASLAITVMAESRRRAWQESIGMVAGGLGMAACCIVAAAAIPRARAVRGSMAAWICWGAVSLGLYWAVFIGSR